MRAALRTLTLAGLFLVLGASLAAAQHPQIREGFWIGFGFGYGSAHEHPCDGCVDTTVGGFTGFVRLGGTLSRHLRLGGEIDGWTHTYPATATASSAHETMGSITGALYYYPMPASGFFVKGGLGFSNYDFSVSGGGGSVTGVGGGFVTGLGYDIRVGRNFSITPTGDLWYGRVGDVKQGGGGAGPGGRHTINTFGRGAPLPLPPPGSQPPTAPPPPGRFA